MRVVTKWLAPGIGMSRRQYQLAILAVSIFVLFALTVGPALPPKLQLIGCVLLLLLVANLTARRFKDVGVSRWWTLLLFFPFAIDLDVFHAHFAGIDAHFLDVALIIRTAPVVFGFVCANGLTTRLDLHEASATPL